MTFENDAALHSRRHNGGPPIEDNPSPFGKNGWVAVGRDSRYHPIVGFGKTVTPCDAERGFVYSRAEAWQDLIMECRYSTGQVFNGGRVMTIERGQLVGATSWLAHRWNWTPKTVRHFLETIEAAEMAKINAPGAEKPANRADSASADMGSPDMGKQKGKQKGKQSQVLTICNYGIYQLSWLLKGQAKGQEEGQAKGEQGASKGQERGNIYKEEQGNKGTIDYTKAHASRPGVAVSTTEDGARAGEEEVYPGVYVNCETIRHAKFVIPLKSLSMALALANIELTKNSAEVVAREQAIVAAIDWAERLKAGQRCDAINNPVGVIRGTVVAAYQSAKRAGKQASYGGGYNRQPRVDPAKASMDALAELNRRKETRNQQPDFIDASYERIDP